MAAFESSLESDALWEEFLPSDYENILSRAVEPVVACASKKEIYSRLCGSILIDGGRKSFALDKATGKKRFMLSARELHITWSDTPQYWRWLNHPDSRFTEVAELLSVCWLSIAGKINTSELSHNTTYGAYLIYKLDRQQSVGFKGRDQMSSVTTGGVAVQRTIRVQPQPRQLRKRTRPDGWTEVRLGKFFNGTGCDGEVEICFWETDDYNWKSGLGCTVVGRWSICLLCRYHWSMELESICRQDLPLAFACNIICHRTLLVLNGQFATSSIRGSLKPENCM